MSNIGTLNEKPLHAALKEYYAKPDDQFEVSVDGFVIDIVQGDLLIEIQTGNFASINVEADQVDTGASRALDLSHRPRKVDR